LISISRPWNPNVALWLILKALSGITLQLTPLLITERAHKFKKEDPEGRPTLQFALGARIVGM
jgi:hypothetical protein